MNIQEFVSSHANVRPNADIQERWGSRVEANGLNMRGAAGADAYMGQYGKGMKTPKAVMFARMAEIKGFPEMARRFWEHAYLLETGVQASLGASVAAAPAPGALPALGIKESFGQEPELLTAVDYDEAMRLAADPRYGVQEKKDGRRLLLRSVKAKAGFTVTGGNKKGLCVIPPLPVSDVVSALKMAVEMDGENVNGVFYAFDLLSLDGEDYRQRPYRVRHAALAGLLSRLASAAVELVPLLVTREEKLAFIAKLRARGAEGFVLKLLDEAYAPGENTQRKHQFRAINAFVVGERNGAKNSVAISVRRADGSIRSMGNLTIPGRTPIPAPGSVVEVEYLYCHTGAKGKLHQPVFKEVRDDASAEDCMESKLRVKEQAEDE